MKKFMALVIMGIFVCSIFIGCKGNSSSVVGTWYSDRDDGAALVLNKDGTYSDGKWLIGGSYNKDGDTILLTGTLDGQNTLKLQKKNGENVLVYGDESYSHTYYSTEEAARKAREERQAAQKAAEEEKAEKEREAFQASLVGYWCTSGNYPIEFTSDGKYISYPKGQRTESNYKAISKDKILVSADDGTNQEIQAMIRTDGYLQLSTWEYMKAKPLELSLEVLEGEWTDGSLKTVFTKDGTYIEKSAFAGFVKDKNVDFTITGSNTINVPSQGGAQWAFLSETDSEYQLFLSKFSNGMSYTVLLKKAK